MSGFGRKGKGGGFSFGTPTPTTTTTTTTNINNKSITEESEGPAMKKQKVVDGNDITTDESESHLIEKVEIIQNNVLQLDEQQAIEIMNITKKYAQLKAPILQKRQETLSKIPTFWLKTLLANETIGESITELDQEVFRYLISFDCIEMGKNLGDTHFRLEFTFDQENDTNPFFHNEKLWKEYQITDEEGLVTCSDILWKDTEESKAIQETLIVNLWPDRSKQPKEDDPDPSFLSIFDEEDKDFDMGEVFRTQIWNNPVQLFLSADFSEVEDNDEDDE